MSRCANQGLLDVERERCALHTHTHTHCETTHRHTHTHIHTPPSILQTNLTRTALCAPPPAPLFHIPPAQKREGAGATARPAAQAQRGSTSAAAGRSLLKGGGSGLRMAAGACMATYGIGKSDADRALPRLQHAGNAFARARKIRRRGGDSAMISRCNQEILLLRIGVFCFHTRIHAHTCAYAPSASRTWP